MLNIKLLNIQHGGALDANPEGVARRLVLSHRGLGLLDPLLVGRFCLVYVKTRLFLFSFLLFWAVELFLFLLFGGRVINHSTAQNISELNSFEFIETFRKVIHMARIFTVRPSQGDGSYID